MSKLVVHIDRLVLRGVDPGDTAAFSAALQAEVQQQLAQPGTSQQIDRTHRSRIDAGRVRGGDGTLANSTASAIAKAIAGGRKP